MEEDNGATKTIRGPLGIMTDNDDTSGFLPHLVRPDSNVSEGRHSSTSSSLTYMTRSPEGSESLSRIQTRRSVRTPSEIYHEKTRLRPSRSPLPAQIEEDRTSANNEEQALDLETEQVTPVLGTDHRLHNFETVIERATSNHPELVQQRWDRRKRIQRQQEVAAMPRRALKALRGRIREEKKQDASSGYSSPLVRTISNALFQKEVGFPEDDDLIRLAHHFYPPIGQTEVHIFDFGPNYFRHTTTTVADIEQVFGSRPKEVKVRWIHAPLGIGITQASVEELFKKAGPGPGKHFHRGGGNPWPDLYDPVLEFHHKDYFKEKRDTFFLLRDRQALSKILDDTLFLNVNNDKIRKDVQWRCDHLNIDMTFWNVMQCGSPDQLSESILTGVVQWPSDGVRPTDRPITEQMFSRHPFYKQARARLVKTIFRIFHRDDGQSSPLTGFIYQTFCLRGRKTGCLLTISPMNGINYVDKDFSKKLKEPPQCRIFDESTSALARVWQVFEKTGTSTWPSETVEWFLVYLVTELAITPHTISQGFNAPSLVKAYAAVALDLVSILKFSVRGKWAF